MTNQIKNRMKKLANQDNETRVYKLTSSSKSLDGIEELLLTLQNLSNIGASSDIKIFVDGDGAFRLKVEKENGKLNEMKPDDIIDKELIKFNFE